MLDDKSTDPRHPFDPDQTVYEPPINRFPPEILTKILELRELERDLIFATHVCRHWRSILISSPFLWTRIPCCNVDRTSTYLERSTSAPIDIITKETTPVSPSDSALELIIPHLGRVMSMIIIPSPGKILPAISRFRRPAPLLQRLKISGFPRGYISRLPRDFLGCYVPSLRSLHWNDLPPILVSFPLSGPILPSYNSDEVPIPLHAVLGLISSAPLLEDLSISILDPDVSPDLPPVQNIHLGSLRRLHVISGVALSRILPYFKVPRLKEFSLFLSPNLGAPIIADLLPSDSYPLFTEVTSMEFCAGMGNGEIKLVGKGVEVTVRYFPRVDDTDDFLSVTPFSFAQITRLMLKMAVKPIVARIGEFTNLKLLHLISCMEDTEVLLALSPSPASGSLVPCPHLAAVRVILHIPTPHAVDCLEQMVRSRKEAGNPLMAVDFM